MKRLLAIFFYIFFSNGYSQKSYPKNYFDAPLKIPIVLSGTFGELRTGHFHSGIDIKTQNKEGFPIYAPADGYVYRIKVAQYGFGKVLYIKHPNGYTTVYAHLQKFSPEIQKYVKQIQYQKKSYSTGNIFPKPEKFTIKRGDIIGYTGDTGGSNGPHLHYEIRDTKTGRIINPMHFGLIPEDTRKPFFQKILVYPISKNARINNTQKKTILPFTKLDNGNYVTNKINAYGYIGLGVSVYDRQNGAYNKNGIYSLEMKVNGQRYYYYDVETFSFAETKFINLLIDYKHFAKFRNRIHKTFKHPASKLSMYKNLVDDGKIYIENGASYNIEIIAKDFVGNSSKVSIPILGVPENIIFKEKDTATYKINAKEFNKFSLKDVTIAFPKNTFYDDCYLNFSVDLGTAKIHEPTIPLNKRFTLTFNVSHLSEEQKRHAYIANVTKPEKSNYTTTKKKGDKIYTTSKTLGSYKVLFDKDKPIIKLVNFKNNQWISANQTLKVKVKDEKAGIKDWYATIDNEWILMEYNHKKGILTYDFSDKKLVGSKHLFKIVVSDNVGNTKKVSISFFKKQAL